MIILIVSVLLRIVGLYLLIGIVLPKQYGEMRVVNGIGKLRTRLFYWGVSFTTIVVISTVISVLRIVIDGEVGKILADINSLLSAVGIVIIAWIQTMIYLTTYKIRD